MVEKLLTFKEFKKTIPQTEKKYAYKVEHEVDYMALVPIRPSPFDSIRGVKELVYQSQATTQKSITLPPPCVSRSKEVMHRGGRSQRWMLPSKEGWPSIREGR